MPVQLYPARVACRVARISARNLDYWVTTRLVSPHSIYRGPNARREFFLFSFGELVQLRVIAALRRTGVSLQKIREALIAVKERAGTEWHALWLLSDGANIHIVRQTEILETLTGEHKGQLAFALVAMGSVSSEVQGALLRLDAVEFDGTKLPGKVHRFAE